MTASRGTGLIGIATAKKIGNAPQRNRAKRRFREVLRSLPECLDSRLDYVVVVLAASTDAKLDQIRTQLADLARELNNRWEKDLESS